MPALSLLRGSSRGSVRLRRLPERAGVDERRHARLTVGVPDAIYGEEVVCYVIAKERGLTEASVLEHCRKYLPALKVPKQVFIVQALPKNDRGKVLREKLKDDWKDRMTLSA